MLLLSLLNVEEMRSCVRHLLRVPPKWSLKVKIQFPNGDVQPLCPGQVLDGSPIKSPRQIDGFSPVLEWLHSLGLDRYQKFFVQEEIDWDTLQWLTEEVCFVTLWNKI
ncbi:hypothetical protein U1Q18_002977 [Sarracenia purpurea var. burkii]